MPLRLRRERGSALRPRAHRICIVLLAASMMACAHSPATLSPLDGAWQLDASGGVTTQAGATTQTIVFADDRAHGDGGCNRWSADVLGNGAGELRFGPVAATRRGCLDAEANRSESGFLAMLGEVRGYRDAGKDRVELLDAGGMVIATLRR
jgi:heat shock protein HslJ